MYGWEKITNMCGLGCKAFWNPWTNSEKLPYDAVHKDETDVTDQEIPVTSEPQKPVWSEIKAPIVRNKSSGSLGNIRNTAGYEKVASTGNIAAAAKPRASDKRNSTTSLNVTSSSSKGLLKEEMKETSRSTVSLVDEKLYVSELVTTV